MGMCSAGIVLFVIGAVAGRKEIARAQGLDKIVALGNLSFALPLAVFGALHLFGTRLVVDIVPEYMPWRLFWAYFVGVALIAASVSIAINTWVRWSGLLFGIMMILFVAMIHFPGALSDPHDRFIWTIVLRELSFGGAGLLLAGHAMRGSTGRLKSVLVIVGSGLVTLTMVFFAVEHFLHPLGLPGVPLRKEMPAWVPMRALIDYVTGAALLVTAGSVVLSLGVRTVGACLGAWILLTVLVIYGPFLIESLIQPDIGTKVQGINYFADTLLFAGVILALAKAAPRAHRPGR